MNMPVGTLAITEALWFSLHAVAAARLRTAMMTLAMAIGVAAVVLLTALGEGARNYVLGEFASLGSNVLTVIPGRSETTGGAPLMLGITPRDLTLDDALSLRRSSLIAAVAPIVVGGAPAAYGARSREVNVIGSTAELRRIRHLELERGRFLPAGDPFAAGAVCVIGSRLRDELFGHARALGEILRIGDRRFRVIGILAPKGQSMGLDMSDVAIIPVAAAQALFDTHSMFRVLVEVRSRDALPAAKRRIEAIIAARHEGENDVTLISLDAILATFDRIFTALTLTVAGIAGISLIVAGILIMNVMLVSVSQRTAEIGLLKALGAPPRIIERLFLVEAGLLSMFGCALGLATGYGGIFALELAFPRFPLTAPLWAALAGIGVALLSGLLFGVLPARRAARLDPVQALAKH
ncbi:ABC transporter permease [Acidihalobacter prosperus]|uniref:Peptide ABC transporter permease n=1 Tax=Acidihalobacter prosperus TaxID=160660 RepID=A0A1A6C1W2_9GAMM|nr:ABC transporter permease [Acidihalobacter prosperus]OBS08556.1 peptide ABC transporter permease [Acidihalobacter prosperus]